VFYGKFEGGFMTKEQFFNCAYCGELVSVVLELSEASQQYTEDCEVCCQPLEIEYTVENETVINFSAEQQNG